MGRELLFSVTRKDLVITPYKGSGAGGQNRNKRETACRIHHPDSGVTTQAEEHRTFEQNRKAAFLRLTNHPKFKIWLAQMQQIAMGYPSIEETVAEQMKEKNLRVEVKDENGRWVAE